MASQRQPDYDWAFPILLLGEGDFSFAVALFRQHLHFDGSRLVATTLDDEDTVVRKYGERAVEHLSLLRAHHVQVQFGVDATKVDTIKKIRKRPYGRIIFNFPHTGAGIKDMDRNIRHHQELLRDMFTALHRLIHSVPSDLDGYDAHMVQVHVALKTGEPYASWNIKGMARSAGFVTRFSALFDASRFPGYTHCCTHGLSTTHPDQQPVDLTNAQGSRVYVFVLHEAGT